MVKMGYWERFKSMPLGVKIIFALVLLSFLNSIFSLPLVLSIKYSSLATALYAYALIVFSLLFVGLLQIWALWSGKKFTEKLYLVFIIFSIVNLFFLFVVFPNYIAEISKSLVDAQLAGFHGLSAAELERMSSLSLQLAVTMTQFSAILNIPCNRLVSCLVS